MSLMFRFMLSLCLLLSGALAHPCSHHGFHCHKTEISFKHNKEVQVRNAPAPNRRTTNDEIGMLEIEEDEDPVPSRKELHPGKRVFNVYNTPANTCKKANAVSLENVACLSSPAFIVNCVFRI